MTPLYAPLFVCLFVAIVSGLRSVACLDKLSAANSVYGSAKASYLKSFGEPYRKTFKKRWRQLCWAWVRLVFSALIFFISLIGSVFYLLTLFLQCYES